jgi:hypothetical protein
MAFATAALAIIEVVKLVQAELIANDVAGLDPQMEKCVKAYFSNHKHAAEMLYAFGIDLKRRASGKTTAKTGRKFYGNAGGASALMYRKALRSCNAHPLTIALSNREWFESFGNKHMSYYEDKKIKDLKKQLKEQKAAGGGGGETGGTTLSPAIMAAGLVVAYLMLKK